MIIKWLNGCIYVFCVSRIVYMLLLTGHRGDYTWIKYSGLFWQQDYSKSTVSSAHYCMYCMCEKSPANISIWPLCLPLYFQWVSKGSEIYQTVQSMARKYEKKKRKKNLSSDLVMALLRHGLSGEQCIMTQTFFIRNVLIWHSFLAIRSSQL